MNYIDLMGFGQVGWGRAMLAAAAMTLAVSLAAMAIGGLIGVLIAAAKLSRSRAWRAFGEGYTTVLRGVPDLLVIYLVYFGGSTIVSSIGAALGQEGFIGLPSFLAGSLAVGLVSGAYQAEVYRGAYRSVPIGQIEAAKACGMGRLLRFRHIVVPLVLRFALPGLGNIWQLALKESALVSVTGLVELLRMSQIGAGSTRQPFAFYLTAGALYLVLTTVSSAVFRRAEAVTMRGTRRL
jgi:octopine/nopaline transport system permease protein